MIRYFGVCSAQTPHTLWREEEESAPPPVFFLNLSQERVVQEDSWEGTATSPAGKEVDPQKEEDCRRGWWYGGGEWEGGGGEKRKIDSRVLRQAQTIFSGSIRFSRTPPPALQIFFCCHHDGSVVVVDVVVVVVFLRPRPRPRRGQKDQQLLDNPVRLQRSVGKRKKKNVK